MGCVLLHLKKPFHALQKMLCLTIEKAIIIDFLPTGSGAILRFFPKVKQRIIKKTRTNIGVPHMELLPGSDDMHMFA